MLQINSYTEHILDMFFPGHGIESPFSENLGNVVLFVYYM